MRANGKKEEWSDKQKVWDAIQNLDNNKYE